MEYGRTERVESTQHEICTRSRELTAHLPQKYLGSLLRCQNTDETDPKGDPSLENSPPVDLHVLQELRYSR